MATSPLRRKRRRLMYVVIAVGTALLVVAFVAAGLWVATVVGQIRNAQVTNTSAIQLIESCTNPEGQCYQDAEKRTTAAVVDIDQRQRRAAAAAVACADEPGTQTQDEVFDCVLARLKMIEGTPP